ncbi:MAG: LytTR family transcriptional regulator [Clostridioides sp.]|jgi:DNA-binding LytR/AlgR family response regulator|nr:LytTR family transcriptional regulator [Clostridioides sp.]
MYRAMMSYNDNESIMGIREIYKDLFQYKVNGKISFENKKMITFFQIEGRKIRINKQNGETEIFYASIEDLAEELKKDEFIRIHKSYLVNSMYVKQFSHNRIVLYDGTELSVSRKYSKKVREFFIDRIKKIK